MSSMLILQFLVLTAIISGVIIFFLHRTLIASTDGAVKRLNDETEQVRAKQNELNQKIKEASEELEKRKKEADDLVKKMTTDAEEAAKAEREKMLNKARQDGEAIIAKAENRKEDIRKAISKEMDLKAVDLTMEVLNFILSEKAKGAFNQQLVVEFVESLEKIDMKIVTADTKIADLSVVEQLSPVIKERILKTIKQKLNRDIELNIIIDPKVIAGITLRFGSLSLDGSFRNLLRETALTFKEKIETGEK